MGNRADKELAMPQLNPLISLVFIIPLIIFWLYMFDDMLKNDRFPNGGPLANVTSNEKSDWTLAFIFLNVFAAVFYYSLVYRNKR
jgi:hypothetical protein